MTNVMSYDDKHGGEKNTSIKKSQKNFKKFYDMGKKTML